MVADKLKFALANFGGEIMDFRGGNLCIFGVEMCQVEIRGRMYTYFAPENHVLRAYSRKHTPIGENP